MLGDAFADEGEITHVIIRLIIKRLYIQERVQSLPYFNYRFIKTKTRERRKATQITQNNLSSLSPLHTHTHIQIVLGGRMLRLDRYSVNTEVGRPFVKTYTHCIVSGTCRTQISPRATLLRMKCKSISTCLVH